MAHERPPGAARCWHGLIGLLFLFLSAPTHAYYLPLVFVPAQPVEGEIGTVIVSVGACDALAAGAHLNRLLTVEGTIVRIELRGVTSFFSPCYFPAVSVPVELVPLPAGSYQVDVYRRQLSFPDQIDLMVSAPLVVVPAQTQVPAHPIPALDIWWLLALCGAVVGVARLLRRQG